MSSYSTGFSWKQLCPCHLQPCRLTWHSQAVLAFMLMWVKTFCRHLYGVFNSAPGLGDYYFCPNIKFSWPLDSVTAEAGAGGKSWHITDWGLRILQACCLIWTSLVPGCCSLNKFMPPVHVPLACCGLQGAQQIQATVVNPRGANGTFQCRSWPVWYLLYQKKKANQLCSLS